MVWSGSASLAAAGPGHFAPGSQANQGTTKEMPRGTIADSDGVSSRIIGGSEAPAGSWPSQVALLRRRISDGFQAQFCGGTLIAERWVLTAAHCVDSSAPENLDVSVGINDLEQIERSDRLPLKAIVIHPQYDPNSLAWDFALLYLAEGSVQPPTPLLQPAEESATSEGSPGEIAGWGCIDYLTSSCDGLSYFPTKLNAATISFVSDSDCSGAYGAEFEAASMICAGIFPSGGIDTCYGDSGGPLLADPPGPAPRALAGVTSWGEGCALEDFPGIYSRVLSARDWIVGVQANPPITTYLLGISTNGSGSGSVSCSAVDSAFGPCSYEYPEGSSLRLRAEALDGSSFSGWSGACAGQLNPCSIDVKGPSSVAASFSKVLGPLPSRLRIRSARRIPTGRRLPVTLELANLGDRAIENLRLRIRWRGKGRAKTVGLVQPGQTVSRRFAIRASDSGKLLIRADASAVNASRVTSTRTVRIEVP